MIEGAARTWYADQQVGQEHRVDSYNIADAKARLSELVERATAGEEIEIKKRGEPVAKIVPVQKPRTKIDVGELRRLTAGQKPWVDSEGDGSFVAWLRRTDQL
jgi:prevent-host-death family protein